EATLRAAEFGVVPFVTPDKKTLNCVMIPDADADAFCAWMTSRDRQSGRLDIDHEYAWRAANIPQVKDNAPRPGWQAIRTEILRVPYGRLSIDSTPRGAEVFDGELRVGRTPLQLTKVRADKFEYEVRLPGYKSEFARGNLKESQAMSFNLRLRATGSVVFGKPWENSLGIKMVPMGRAMLATIETRRKDFAEFARSTNLAPAEGRELNTDDTFPVTYITRAEAEQFCRWLTDRERGKGLLEPDQEYRLPTDDEWSMASYLPRELGATPADRSTRIQGIYPWGFTAVPTSKIANLFDKSADKTGKKSVPGYDDRFAGLAPVASFRADTRSLFDLSGNVWEWVSDGWDASGTEAVARGAAYTTYEQQELLASYRRKVSLSAREPDVGFRILLITSGLNARDDE
ncbi:MAG: SUMF1/EgtB/PvdO family nonheme iron enzyme, partial [Prosthecobacter sp.]|nr:SUMF1/EgtB/PvdO family nonheme iron enzyme [Prosthecobacter sp.]